VDTSDIMDLMDPNGHISNNLSEIKQSSSPSRPIGSGSTGTGSYPIDPMGGNIPRPLPLIVSDTNDTTTDPGMSMPLDLYPDIVNLSSPISGNSNKPSPITSQRKRIKWSLDVNLSNSCGNGSMDLNLGDSQDISSLKSDNSVFNQIDRNSYWQTRKSVKIGVRVRPPTVQEIESKFTRVVSIANENNINNHVVNDRMCIMNPTVTSLEDPDEAAAGISSDQVPEWARVFDDIDHCFWSYGPAESGSVYIKQRDIHDAIGAEMVYHAWNGMSSTCVCYGQTKSGTYTYLYYLYIPISIHTDRWFCRYKCS